MSEILDLTLIRTFQTVVSCRSFSGAAVVLGLSQPAVSQQIRTLEERTGFQLIDRKAKAFTLTTDGQRTIVEARRIIDVYEGALQRLGSAEPRDIVLGVTEHVARHLLGDVLAALEQSYPDRRVKVKIASAVELRSGISSEVIDIVLLLEHSASAVGDSVGEFELRWFSSTAAVPLTRTGQVKLVVSEHPCNLRNTAEIALADWGIEAMISAECSSVEGVMAAVRAGLGVALLPSTGEVPTGLVERSEFASQGHIAVRMLHRQGIEAGLAESGARGARSYFERATAAMARPPMALIEMRAS